MKSKFSYITYPFFGTYVVPDVEVQFDEILATTTKKLKSLKLSNSSNYLEELFDIQEKKKNNRFSFDITANSTSELIMLPKRCLWGVDIRGEIHNLSRKQIFDHICIKPRSITKDKYIWFREVTPPLVTPIRIQQLKDDLLNYWFSFLYIDTKWELYSVNPFFTRSKAVCL